MPRRDDAIGRHGAVQRAGGRTVGVVQIGLDDAAETADVEAYLDDAYGPSTSPLHRGVPTDRFIASWHIGSPHVARRVEAGAIVARDANVGQAPHVLRTREEGTFRAPHGEPDLSHDEPRLRVEIPADFARMLGEATDLALAWRHAARRVFHTYFARGYRVVDVDAERGAPRPSYLLALPVLSAALSRAGDDAS